MEWAIQARLVLKLPAVVPGEQRALATRRHLAVQEVPPVTAARSAGYKHLSPQRGAVQVIETP